MKNLITTKELKAKLDQNQTLFILEALPSKYYFEGHLPRALNIPLDAKDETIQQMLPDRSKEIVTYCTGPTCPNSARLANRLASLGYTNVKVYEDGKSGWMAAGHQIEK